MNKENIWCEKHKNLYKIVQKLKKGGRKRLSDPLKVKQFHLWSLCRVEPAKLNDAGGRDQEDHDRQVKKAAKKSSFFSGHVH